MCFISDSIFESVISYTFPKISNKNGKMSNFHHCELTKNIKTNHKNHKVSAQSSQITKVHCFNFVTVVLTLCRLWLKLTFDTNSFRFLSQGSHINYETVVYIAFQQSFVCHINVLHFDDFNF